MCKIPTADHLKDENYINSFLDIDTLAILEKMLTADIYTIAVTGSSFCPEVYKSKDKLQKIITRILERKGKVMFLVTRDSDLGRLTSQIIDELKGTYLWEGIYHFLVIPYPTEDYLQNLYEYNKYYTWVVALNDNKMPDCTSIRDKYITDHCDMLICHFSDTSDKMFEIINYADAENKRVICI